MVVSTSLRLELTIELLSLVITRESEGMVSAAISVVIESDANESSSWENPIRENKKKKITKQLLNPLHFFDIEP